MWDQWLTFILTLGIWAVVAVVAAFAVTVGVRILVRKRAWPTELTRRARRPFRVLILLLGIWIAVVTAYPDETSLPVLSRSIGIAAIGVTAWLLTALVLFSTDMMLGRFRIDVPDNRHARRIRTQTLILRRLTIALIIVIAVASILLTFPAVRTIGASLLASAGIASIVAGLAAQSVLANMFAGIQLVFSDAIRVDDVVVAGGEWGRVGEITLSYVVLNVWDERRLVLPCTYFTTQPFENWTREGSGILGSVELDLDWRTPVSRIRERLADVLAVSDLWDGRTSVVQVTDATGGLVRVRVLMSAADSGSLWDLRCVVREDLVAFVRRETPDALPMQRIMMADHDTRVTEERDHVTDPEPVVASEGMFSGSAEAEERHREFTQAIPVIRADSEADATVVEK